MLSTNSHNLPGDIILYYVELRVKNSYAFAIFYQLGIDRRLYLKAGTYKRSYNIISADNFTVYLEDISDVFPSGSVIFE